MESLYSEFVSHKLIWKLIFIADIFAFTFSPYFVLSALSMSCCLFNFVLLIHRLCFKHFYLFHWLWRFIPNFPGFFAILLQNDYLTFHAVLKLFSTNHLNLTLDLVALNANRFSHYKIFIFGFLTFVFFLWESEHAHNELLHEG